ncbi:MAG: hypothetical protein Kow0063_12350 [Anaerolineae bacterium]
MRPGRSFRLLGLPLGLILVLAWLLEGVPSIARGDAPNVQDQPITYLHYNVDIALKPNGNFVVSEIQQIQFNGQFRTAFAEIPRDYVSDIANVRVWEGDKPYTYVPGDTTEAGTFTVRVEASNVYIEWHYQETSPGEVRTFLLQYEIIGGLWVYTDETILEWRAIPADRSGFPILASQVTVNLPAEVAPAELRYTAYGPEFTVQVVGNQIIFEATQVIPDGVRFQVQVGFPPGLVVAEVQPWQIEEDTADLEYRLEAMDVDLVIDSDGQVAVTEHQRVAVDAGALYSGQRSIRLAYLDRIVGISLFEGDQPFSLDQGACGSYCFRVDEPAHQPDWIWYDAQKRAVVVDETRAGQVAVEWYFPALVRGEVTTFHLQYEALGAIQVNEDSQRLNWTVIFPRRDVPVQAASVHIQLPPGIVWQDVSLEGGAMRVQPDSSIRVLHEAPIKPGEAWQIGLIMPAGATKASLPAWQRSLAVAQAEARLAEIRLARQQVVAGVGGALILVVGLLAVLLSWYVWGRDRPMEIAAEYLDQPPSELAPGIVAYLVDEMPTPKGVLASLFHLASLGLLRIDLTGQQLLLQCNWGQDLARGQSLQMPSGEMVAIPGHLVTLFNKLRPVIAMDRPTPLSRISYDFRSVLPAVYAEMAEEASAFFSELPASARHRWLSFGQWLVLAGVAGAVVAWFALVPELGFVGLAPPLAVIPVGLAFTLVSRWMPQRTSAGREEAARWRAFRHYLHNLKDYGDLAEAQKVLDDYFAYAVALDVEDVVLAQAEELGSVMPVWTYPTRLEPAQGPQELADVPVPQKGREPAPLSRPLRVTWWRRPGSAQQEAVAEAASDQVPGQVSLQGLSRQLGRTLENASQDIGRLLNTAVGRAQGDTPFRLVLKGAEKSWDISTATARVIGDILEESAAGGGSGGYRGRSSGYRRSSSTRWSSRSSRGSSRGGFSGRSSSSRRSGGGGRRGFR